MELEDKLYQAFSKAETGGEANPWIRTKIAPKEGSTAYGPVQITRSLMEGYKRNYSDLFDKEELKYIDRFLAQGDLFNMYGREPDKEGYDPRFDYGGTGYLYDEKDRKLYESVAKKMLRKHYEDAGGDLESTIKAWRFGPNSDKGKDDDKRYYNLIQAEIGGELEPSSPEKPTTNATFAEAMEAREKPLNAPQTDGGTSPQGEKVNRLVARLRAENKPSEGTDSPEEAKSEKDSAAPSLKSNNRLLERLSSDQKIRWNTVKTLLEQENNR